MPPPTRRSTIMTVRRRILYFFSNTITRGGFDPRTDSTVSTLPSTERERVSVRTVFLPATALSPVQVVTSLPPSHLLTVSFGPPIGDSFVTGLPVKSRRVLLSRSFPWYVECALISSAVSD